MAGIDVVEPYCQLVKPWASKLRTRKIGDFTNWNEHDAYKATFDRVLRDSRAKR
jgi:hypothetical protein